MKNLDSKITLFKKLSNELLQAFGNLTPEQFEQKSKCHQWAIKDIGSHLIATTGFAINSIQRSVQGDYLPAEGQPNPGSANSQSMAAGIASRAIQISETDLPNNSELINVLFEMEKSLLNVFLSIDENQWELPAYHPIAKFSPQLFLDISLIELILHSWDINSALNSNYEINSEESKIINQIWLNPEINNWLYTPDETQESELVCDINLSEPLRIITWRDQIVISEIPSNSNLVPNATIEVRENDFPLLISARDNIEIAIEQNRAEISGEKDIIYRFHQWFKGT